jgi:hypothetical protein
LQQACDKLAMLACDFGLGDLIFFSNIGDTLLPIPISVVKQRFTGMFLFLYVTTTKQLIHLYLITQINESTKQKHYFPSTKKNPS